MPTRPVWHWHSYPATLPIQHSKPWIPHAVALSYLELAVPTSSSCSSISPASSGGRKVSLLTLFTQLSFAPFSLSLFCSAETGNNKDRKVISHLHDLQFSYQLLSLKAQTWTSGLPWVPRQSVMSLNIWDQNICKWKSVDFSDISSPTPRAPSKVSWEHGCTFKCAGNSRDTWSKIQTASDPHMDWGQE